MSGNYHESRLAPDKRRSGVWSALWHYYFRYRITPQDCVLDLGAGYGDFINSITASRRIALDMWPGVRQHVAPDVEVIIGSVEDMSAVEDDVVDFAFASNLFEHLSQQALVNVLSSLKAKMSDRGRLTLLQPNYRYAFREYFDDYTHVTAYSHISLTDLLTAHGWEVLEVHPRFLPLSIKSRLPTWKMLVGAYLRSPFKPLGKQMLIVARPAQHHA